MKLAIMQPYFFPYIGYWQLLNLVDKFVIFDDVNFIKKGYINRNSILIQGQPNRLTLQLIKASQNKLINDTSVGGNRLEILNTISHAYKKAPYFDTVFPMIETILRSEELNLAKFIGLSLKTISNYLDIKTEFLYSSEVEKDNNLKGESKILEVCKALGAKSYFNAIGGQALYNKETFENKGVKLLFVGVEPIRYKQFGDDFVPNLSIIDILVFNSESDIKSLLEKYSLE